MLVEWRKIALSWDAQVNVSVKNNYKANPASETEQPFFYAIHKWSIIERGIPSKQSISYEVVFATARNEAGSNPPAHVVIARFQPVAQEKNGDGYK